MQGGHGLESAYPHICGLRANKKPQETKNTHKTQSEKKIPTVCPLICLFVYELKKSQPNKHQEGQN
jgi:hypothetical protein